MSPLCRFDLGRDDHFSHFIAWIDAIEQWALTSLLPQVKYALERLKENTAPVPLQPPTPRRLTLSTGENKNDLLIKSLQTTFDKIPWRFEDDEFTPVSSSTASWGSPALDEMIFSNFNFTKTPPKLRLSDIDAGPTTPRPSMADKRMSVPTVPPFTALNSGDSGLSNLISDPGQSVPPPAYTTNPELVWQRRFSHAMDEIQDLQTQLQALRQGCTGSTTSLRKELCGLSTLGSVLRKETVMSRSRILPMSPQSLISQINLEGQSSGPQLALPQLPSPRLQLPELKATKGPRSRLRKISLPPTSPTVTLSMNGVDLVLSPKEISASIDGPRSPFKTMPKSPVGSPLKQIFAPAPETVRIIVSTPSTPVAQSTIASTTPVFSSQRHSAWQWAGTLVSGYVLGALVPGSILSMIVLGCAASLCIRSIGEDGGLINWIQKLHVWRGTSGENLSQDSLREKSALDAQAGHKS